VNVGAQSAAGVKLEDALEGILVFEDAQGINFINDSLFIIKERGIR
jgi:hypothetical protein